MSRWLAPAQCINSSLVGKVTLEPAHESVEQCSPLVKLIGKKANPIVVESQLPARLDRLEPIMRYLAFSQLDPGIRVEVHIRTNQKRQLLVTPQRLDISSDLLETPDLLERALLFAQFPTDTDFSAAVKSQFLYEELLAPRRVTASAGPASALQGLGAYCHSSEVIVAHLTYCDAHNEFGDSNITDQAMTDLELGPTPWSLVGIFVRSLRVAYENLDMKGKERFLKNLIFLSEPDEGSIGSLAKAKSLDSLNVEFKHLIANWLMPLLLDEKAVNLAMANFTDDAKPKTLRYVAVDRSAREVFPIDNLVKGAAATPTPNEMTMVEYGIKKYVFPNDVGYEFDRNQLFSQQKVDQLVYVSCQIPEVENLTQFGAHVSRVLFVRQCNNDDVNWQQALSMGVSKYLAQHPEVEFMEFNLSALRLAKRQEGPLRHPTVLANWQRWLKWQAVVTDDEEPSALRPLAAIEGVRRFRIIH